MTSAVRPRAVLVAGFALLAAYAAGGAFPASRAAADGFRSMMDASMERMHRAMAAPGTGDPDRDFASMMIAHHQGAVEMAETELRFGRDERLRRLAQGIIVEQRQEIAVMRQVLETLPPAAPPGPTRSPMAGHVPGATHETILAVQCLIFGLQPVLQIVTLPALQPNFALAGER
jgi:hypothetical protein